MRATRWEGRWTGSEPIVYLIDILPRSTAIRIMNEDQLKKGRHTISGLRIIGFGGGDRAVSSGTNPEAICSSIVGGSAGVATIDTPVTVLGVMNQTQPTNLNGMEK
ncbi:hypothetical protein NLI96_g416 [Meripilus lineatus]|uniref:Uncharacterized protein n=1 Tax=Meripilus lineatus TaxID=2056292 RepID=A0AAD5VCF3_9APHY|nr:hypothetical protein NLI96_g416 [Physisporinus lineatus]